MRAAPITNKPDGGFMKQTDMLSFWHLQMPRWLFAKKYMNMSLDAKVVYTFLLNRFQLSKLNGWVNDEGEVFIIYTRESLSEEIGISYRKAISCMKELASADLIWERRCGRGDANQIYFIQVKLDENDIAGYSSAPFVPQEDEAAGARPAEHAFLEAVKDDGKGDVIVCIPGSMVNQDLPETQFKTCETGTSRPAGFTGQEVPETHTSYIDIINTDSSDTDKSQSVSCARPPAHGAANGGTDRQADDVAQLDRILESCDLWTFTPEMAKVFENAIERLWYSESFRIGNAVLPQQKVRSHLYELDNVRLQEAKRKIHDNTTREIKNTTVYIMAVIFNTIWECESDVMADPYLNSLRGKKEGGP